MQRPAGITVLAFTMFTSAAILLVISFFCFVAGPAVEELVRMPGVPVYQIFDAAAIGILALIMGLACAVAGAGLWNLQAWGRSLSLILIAISIAVSVVGIAAGLVYLRMMIAILRIVALGVDSLILWYLLQPHVRQSFGAKRS